MALVQWDATANLQTLGGNVGDFLDRLLHAALILAEEWCGRLEAYMKANARWQDRTGNARQGLTAMAEIVGTAIVITLFHTMDYGIWLEVANAGAYAIIMETILTHFQMILDEMNALAGA